MMQRKRIKTLNLKELEVTYVLIHVYIWRKLWMFGPDSRKEVAGGARNAWYWE